MNTKHPLQAYRECQNLTQEGLAAILGVSNQLISHIETGRRPVTPENAVHWEELLGRQLTRYELRPDLFGRRAIDHGPDHRHSA